MGRPKWLVFFPLDVEGGGVVKAAAVSETWTQGREEAGEHSASLSCSLTSGRGPHWRSPPGVLRAWAGLTHPGSRGGDPQLHRAGQRRLEMGPGIPAHTSAP